jgi:hypothetical protein
MRRALNAPLLLVFFAAIPAFGQGHTTIDFEQFHGSSVFGSVQPPLTVGIATFSGGQILNGTTFLPADQSTVYGTASFCSGCGSSINISFSQPVSDFSMLVLNGQTFTVIYTAEDNTGAMQTIVLAANFQSGSGTLSLPTTGIHSVSLTSNAAQFDFFIDNVDFVATDLQVICRPLDSDPKDQKHLRAKLGRHCYFLITDPHGTQSTYGAYDVGAGLFTGGLLTPEKNGDPVNAPGGCSGGITGSDCISTNPPPGKTIDDIIMSLDQAVASGPQGTYDPISNNSNLWMKNRIAQLGLGVSLPATAITSKAEACAQIPIIEQNLKMCNISFSQKLLIKIFAPHVSCP